MNTKTKTTIAQTAAATVTSMIALMACARQAGPPLIYHRWHRDVPPTLWNLHRAPVGVAQPGRARVQLSQRARKPHTRCLKRQLSLPVSTMSQWCVRRSSSAVVISGSPKTVGHSPKARLVVTMIEVRS